MEETATDFMIEATGVQKVYAAGGLRVRALRGVDLGVRRGEMVAVMGPSGCGKTTLLNVLSGLDDLSDGEVYVDGESIKGMSDRKRTRFQGREDGLHLPVLQPDPGPLRDRERRAAAAGRRRQAEEGPAVGAGAVEMVGLADQAKKRPAEMSGGQQQRMTVARSLVNNPAIVWADEPTGALDSETSEGIMDLLVRTERAGAADLRPGHPRRCGRGRAHRTVRMRDGRIESDEPNGKGV